MGKKDDNLRFQEVQGRGSQVYVCYAYDYTTASIVNESECEVILVGDLLAMIMLAMTAR